jgi:hypothetical protein
MKIAICLTLASAAVSTGAFAHHSNAEYDRTTVRELEGEIVSVQWANPHVLFRLRTASAGGGGDVWELSGLPIVLLERAGLSKSMFVVGERVKVGGWASRRRAAMLTTNMLLPNGQEALFYPQSRLRWSDVPAGGRWSRDAVVDDDRGLYRTWSVADLGAYLRTALAITFKLTPSAEAKMGSAPAFDLCKPQGMPGVMLAPTPIRFVDRGDRVDLELTSFAVVRRIVMSADRNLEGVPLSDLGYSTGRWVGETLEVRTTRVGWPYLDDEGRPQTERVEIVERFAVLEDGARLRYTQTVMDPESLVEPMTISWDYIADAAEELTPVSCE